MGKLGAEQEPGSCEPPRRVACGRAVILGRCGGRERRCEIMQAQPGGVYRRNGISERWAMEQPDHVFADRSEEQRRLQNQAEYFDPLT
jgi:hypothetical protein